MQNRAELLYFSFLTNVLMIRCSFIYRPCPLSVEITDIELTNKLPRTHATLDIISTIKKYLSGCFVEQKPCISKNSYTQWCHITGPHVWTEVRRLKTPSSAELEPPRPPSHHSSPPPLRSKHYSSQCQRGLGSNGHKVKQSLVQVELDFRMKWPHNFI